MIVFETVTGLLNTDVGGILFFSAIAWLLWRTEQKHHPKGGRKNRRRA